ncbi:MAG: dTDP-4-dehydrorhamnose reductase [Candidatus Dadabacteria bacterium]|nr:MAG: dTDP-4-dehydrorhamnose reductase [Candidatus Dadabacteria bacterium]
MKILLFGGSGQLGYDLIKRAKELNFDVAAPVTSEVDIANRDQVVFLAEKFMPDLIVNAAAYTNVDQAEAEPEKAYLVNKDGALNVAIAANKCGSRLIHVSTDYVFDGFSSKPRKEDDPVNPLSVYGKSKLEGEKAVLQEMSEGNTLVVRTAWLHGSRGRNFVNTMLDLFKERDEIRVVDDQVGNPTWTGWLAEVILDLGRMGQCHGIVHAVCSGAISWYEFACRIYDLVRGHKGYERDVKIYRQSTEEAGRPAPRPPFSALDTTKLTGLLGRAPMSWEDGLKRHLAELGIG